RLLDAGADRRDELPRHLVGGGLAGERQPGAARRRLDGEPDVAVLAAAADLADELAIHLGAGGHRLAVGDLRAADPGLDLELAGQAVHQDLQVELAHAGDDGLLRLRVGRDPEGGVLDRQRLQRPGEAVLLLLVLRLDRDADDRAGELQAAEDDRRGRIAQGVAGGRRAQADGGADVARLELLELAAAVGVHPDQPADLLQLAAGGVEELVAGPDRAGVDAQVGDRTDLRVVHDLEGDRRGR